MVCCYFIPSYGPLRHLLLALLVALSAMGVRVALGSYQVPDGVTPGPEEAATSRTAQVLLILIMTFAGAAVAVNLLVTIVAVHEDNVRRRQEEHQQSTLQKRSWLTNFLDPQFLNKPKHIKQRQKFFQYLNETSRIHQWGFMAPSLALLVILLIRLFIGAPVFLGDPAALDFGWKYGINSGIDAEKSVSFTVDSNSYSHAIQGFLASLLGTPVVTKGIFRLAQRKFKGLFQIAPYVLTIYPTYNLIKRFMRAREAFAGSSFANNGFEWAAGFVVGLALGQLITAIRSFIFVLFGRQVRPCSSQDCEQGRNNDEDEGESKSDDAELTNEIMETSFAVKFIRFTFAILLVFTVYAAGILYGMTWYSCLTDTTCVNASFAPEVEGEVSKLSSKVLAIMVVVPSIMMMVVPMI